MFSQFVSFVTHASHEIMHIEFLKKYHKYCLNKGLTEKQVQHLKEILTVLLNEDMKDFLSVPDRGYDGHKKIREEILKCTKNTKKQNKVLLFFWIIPFIYWKKYLKSKDGNIANFYLEMKNLPKIKKFLELKK